MYMDPRSGGPLVVSNVQSPIWRSKLPEDTRGNKIATEIDLSYHVVLTEKPSTRVTDSCKRFPKLSLASSSKAMSIDWRTE